MKNRIYIEFPAEMTEKNIKFMESLISPKFHGRTKLDEYRAYIDLISSDNPANDEVSEFILNLDGTEFATFWGKPLDDDSNSTNNQDFRNIAICEIEDYDTNPHQ